MRQKHSLDQQRIKLIKSQVREQVKEWSTSIEADYIGLISLQKLAGNGAVQRLLAEHNYKALGGNKDMLSSINQAQATRSLLVNDNFPLTRNWQHPSATWKRNEEPIKSDCKSDSRTIQRYLVRPPRLQIRNGRIWGGEAFHLYTGRDRSESLQLERLLTTAEQSEMESAIQDPEIQLMLHQLDQVVPRNVIIVHRVARILPGEPNGRTLRRRETPSLPPNIVHVAIADSGAARFQSVLWHELFHAFYGMLLVFESGQPASYRRERTRARIPFLHDVTEALQWPQASSLARAVGANSSYRFGWFESPITHTWLHMDNLQVDWQTLRNRGNQTVMQSIEVVRRRGAYEAGFRVSENPEEDAAESFERYQVDANALRQSHPLRWALLNRYFQMLRRQQSRRRR